MTRSLDGRQDALRVVALYLLICEGLAIATRLALKKIIIGTHGLDDATAVISLAFSVVSGVTAALAAENGLGLGNLARANQNQIRKLQQLAYLSEIFHVLCQCLIRVSMLLFIKQIFVTGVRKYTFNGGIRFVALWGLVSTVLVAFQCQTPEPWNLANGDCINMGVFWSIYNCTEIIIDLLMITLPASLSYSLEMTFRKRIIVLTYFFPWVGAIAVAATSIPFTQGFSEANNATPTSIGAAIWPWFLCAQVLRAISILSACIPYLRPLIAAAPSGLYQTDEIRRRGLNYTDFRHGFVVSGNSGSENAVYYLRETVNSFA